MTRIGIIGAGIAGLQLGLFLRHAGVEVTIYTEQTADQLLSSRVPNAVLRSAPTRARERLLGVAHWDDEDVALTHLTLRIQGERPLSFSGAYDEPCMSVDMRIYCARLLEDFARRGGHVRVGTLQLEDVAALAGEHDLVVVATGRGALGTLFPRIAEYSPFTSPQRLVVGGFYHGVAPDEPRALDFTYVPGQGEILSFPVVSFEPGLTVIAFESIAGGAFEPVARMRYVDDPGQFEASVLDLLRTYAPSIHARIDRDAFALSRRLDPEEMSGVLRAFQDAAAGGVARFEGHVAKFLASAFEHQPNRLAVYEPLTTIGRALPKDATVIGDVARMHAVIQHSHTQEQCA